MHPCMHDRKQRLIIVGLGKVLHLGLLLLLLRFGHVPPICCLHGLRFSASAHSRENSSYTSSIFPISPPSLPLSSSSSTSTNSSATDRAEKNLFSRLYSGRATS